MSVVELLIASYLATRLIDAAEQAWANWCTMRVRLGIQKDMDDEKVGFD